MDWKTIILIIALFPNIILGMLSYYKGKKTKSSHLWTALIWTLIIWITAMTFYRLASPQNAVILCRALYVAASFIPPVFLFFSFLFPEEKWPYGKWTRILLLLPTLIIIFLVMYPNAIIKDVKVLPGQESKIIWGPFYIIYALYFSVYFTWTLWNVFKKYLKAEGLIKNHLCYIFLGTGISSVLGVIFNLFLPWIGNFTLNWLGQVTTLFMVAAITYAIYRYRLMDIRVILTEFLIILIAFLLLMEVIISETIYGKIYKTAIFLIFCFFGYLLIKNIINEIKRRKDVEKLNKAKSEFISIASHQLRTPLAAIKGYISMMIEGTYGKLTPEFLKPLKNVYESNEKLTKLVNDLLDLSRLEAGKIEFSPALNSLEKIVLSVIEDLKINADKKGLYLKITEPKEIIPDIMVDESKIRQVILNIIDNAIKYTGKGGITIKIKVAGPKEQIIISDTGIGINQEEMKNLFQMFSRANSGTKLNTEGAGIGLHVAKKFVEMHGGKIWIESQGEGHGSAFYVELPIK